MKERDINSNRANWSKQINSTAGAIKCDFKKKNTFVLIAFNVIRQVAKRCFLHIKLYLKNITLKRKECTFRVGLLILRF